MTALHDLVVESGLPRHEAERLLLVATGGSRMDLLSQPEVGPAVAEEFRRLAAARRGGEPLQYLEGTVQFGPLEFAVDRRALIPRPETEQLWEMAVHELAAQSKPVVVDLCTGSGNLALAIQYVFPDADVHGTDVSARALDLARENAARTGLVGVQLLHGDLFDPLPDRLRGGVDLIVSNPPYLAEEEHGTLPTDVRDHEPRSALVAGPTGDEVLARIAAGAEAWLRPGGAVICEVSELRPNQARRLFAAYRAEIREDLAGRPRFVFGRRQNQRPAPTSLEAGSGSRLEEMT